MLRYRVRRRSQQRVGESVKEDVAIGMPNESALVIDVLTAEHQLAPFHEAVRVETDPNPRAHPLRLLK